MADAPPIMLNVGSNWDMNLIVGLKRLQKQYWDHFGNVKIHSLYGSIPNNPWRTARPSHRLRDVSLEEFGRVCATAHDAGFEINYTLNASCFGDLSIFEPGPAHDEAIYYLEAINTMVDRYTVAHPLMLDTLHKVSEKPIEISVIMAMRTIGQVLWAKNRWPDIDRVCIALDRNRDIGWLKKATRFANKVGVFIELLANEFCSIGGNPCQGLLRTTCYQCHSHDVGNRAGGYPMNICTASRWEQPASWLKAKFILPQWMRKYQTATGINHFKITGRTHPTEYILSVVESYLHEHYEGNLLNLWAQLETIWRGFEAQEKVTGNVDIPVHFIEYNNFIDQWFNIPNFRCSEQACGLNCLYCDSIYNTIQYQMTARKKLMEDKERDDAKHEGS